MRPVKLFRGLEAASPLKDELLSRGVDFVIVRENSEGLYSRMGGLTEHNATDINLFTERGVRRILEFAFQLAEKRDKRLISVDKANVLSASLVLAQEIRGDGRKSSANQMFFATGGFFLSLSFARPLAAQVGRDCNRQYVRRYYRR